MIHAPVHASWLNQIEIYFSILQRKVLTPNDVTDLNALSPSASSIFNTTGRALPDRLNGSSLDRILRNSLTSSPPHADLSKYVSGHLK